MKKGLLAALLVSFAGFAWADVTLVAPKGLNDVCKTISGPWQGNGTVKTKVIFPVVCRYHGEGVVRVNQDNTIAMDLNLTKESGVCPAGQAFLLTGTCENGVISLHVQGGNFNGTLSPDGRSADMTGKVAVEVMGSKVIADVTEMHLEKK